MNPADLASRRWFRSKQRPIAAITVVDQAPIGPGALVVLEVVFADGGPPERYLAPMVDGREPSDGEGAWTAMAAAIGREQRIGPFVAHRAAGFEAGPLDERRLAVEQSNTSVVLGERLILKLYRLLEPGDNPDLEIGTFLTDAGFTDTPALAGSITYETGDVHAAAAMLQAFVPGAGDAWGTMLAALASDPERGIEMAARIGDLTSRLHRCLASRPDDPDFPARPATVDETAAWRASAERQLTFASDTLRGADHERLVTLAPTARARFADAFGSAAGGASVSRIHGDFHLGQLLARPDGGFSVIDFEGEPARPLDERRRPSSPLRDVAGMLRSLDYAARTAERRSGLAADAWLERARRAFLNGYGPTDSGLLAAFELEKACYEVRYEAGMRPDWLWLPMAAVERLVRGP
jgi:maltose alpha-D-glucosyltransferase/alpha-amylase